MNDQTYQPMCLQCDADGVITLATETRWADPLCSDCAQAQDEAAHEASLDAYYGSAGAVSINEFCARAAADRVRSR